MICISSFRLRRGGNYYLYEFRLDAAAWGILDPHIRGFSLDGPLAAEKTVLADLFVRLAAAGGKAFKRRSDGGYRHIGA